MIVRKDAVHPYGNLIAPFVIFRFCRAFLHLILHLLRIKLFHSVEMVISRKPIKKFNRLMDGLFDELLLAE